MITFFIVVQILVVSLVVVMIVVSRKLNAMPKSTMTDFEKEVERITNQDGV